MMTILERVKIRLDGEDLKDPLIEELVQTAKDRILLRVGLSGADEFPAALETIAVEVTVKAWRRQYYEGITSESADTINTSFVEDILAEYAQELSSWKSAFSGEGRVRFL